MASENKFVDILNAPGFHSTIVDFPSAINFTDVMRGFAGSETWRDKSSNTLWSILSACGKDINDIVSDSAINYVRNISDINTARLPALSSMAKMLATNIDAAMDIYNAMPVKLKFLIDIFSIDREYLFGGSTPIASTPLVRQLMQRLKEQLLVTDNEQLRPYEVLALEDVVTEFSKNNHAVSNEKYRAFLRSVFKTFILDILTATYFECDEESNEQPVFIVDNLLHKELAEYKTYTMVPNNTVIDEVMSYKGRHPLDREETAGTAIPLEDPSISAEYTSLGQQIAALQSSLGVSQSFDPWETAQYISEHGMSPTTTLTDNEKVLVEAILNAHNKEMFDYAKGRYVVDNIKSRNAYYRELEFMNYINIFLYLYDTDMNAVKSDPSIGSGKLMLQNNSSHCALDLFNYVETEWVYKEGTTEPEVEPDGTSANMSPTPIGVRAYEYGEKHFIPRLGIEEDNTLYGGYEYHVKYTTDDGTELNRECELDKQAKPTDIISKVCDKLVDLVENILFVRNRLKRQAQFNAMRGTGSLLAHVINDYLLTAYPSESGFNPDNHLLDVVPRWSPSEAYDNQRKLYSGVLLNEFNKKVDENIELFRNYTNVTIVEYMDTTEYFNIRPTSNPNSRDFSMSRRYWETHLPSITDRSKPQLGVFSADEIKEFYKDSLSMGSLHNETSVKDDAEEFLITLYESGATDTEFVGDTGEFVHPINDVANPDDRFAYSNQSDRVKVQNNSELVEKQNDQFLRYTGSDVLTPDAKQKHEHTADIIRALNWKNVQYSSTMLHPFLYTFRLWNPLVNIIINAYSSYSTGDLEKSLTNKYVFDDLFGLHGETKNFWKYNILDYTGYSTRYELEKHSAVDASNEVSPLTGYDGEFYPSAIEEFVNAYYKSCEISGAIVENWEIVGDGRIDDGNHKYELDSIEDAFVPWIGAGQNRGSIFVKEIAKEEIPFAYMKMGKDPHNIHPDQNEKWEQSFEQVIASIYWQIEFWDYAADNQRGATSAPRDASDTRPYRTFYGKWYSHLGYSAQRLQRIAKQLWYWRERIIDAAKHRYEVTNYNLDIGNNSFFLLDTFKDELDPNKAIPDSIQALDKAIEATNAHVNTRVCINKNASGGQCMIINERPKELWIRWNAEPIAMPAFDLYWDNTSLPERFFSDVDDNLKRLSPLGAAGQFEEFGQIKFKNSTTNDMFSDVIEQFKSSYTINPDPSKMDGNKVPVFYSFQQSADKIVFAAWYKEGETVMAGMDRSHLCPIHILCKETQKTTLTDSTIEYNLGQFTDDLKVLDRIGKTRTESFLSAPYVVCSVHGSIVLPSYRIDTPAFYSSPNAWDDPKDEENSYVLAGQTITIKLDELVCQLVNNRNFESTKKHISFQPKTISINTPNLFSMSTLISNNTSVLFSVCSDETFSTATVAFAFLGNLCMFAREQISENLALGATRYVADSDPVETISLLRKKFYKAWDPEVNPRLYSDLRIYDVPEDEHGVRSKEKMLWNSFDRNDKYLCVVQFDKPLNEAIWNTSAPTDTKSFSSRLLNVISDASYIPNFAYQSPFNYKEFPEMSGTNRLWQSSYFSQREHWAEQLLGLENDLMLEYTTMAKNLIIRDETDGFDTYVNPGKVVDAIYRIWEQSELDPATGGIEILYNPQMHLMYGLNPITGERDEEFGRFAVWREQWKMDEEGKEEFLDRYLTIVRCNSRNDGEILNEKNWVLKTTKISELLENVQAQDEYEYAKLALDDFHSEAIGHHGKTYSLTSHIVVGTQDPYRYAVDPDWPTTLRSPAYLLQYGNGIAGVRSAQLRIQIEKNPTYNQEIEEDGRTKIDTLPYLISIEVRLRKTDNEVWDRETPDMRVFMDRITTIPAKSLMMLISQDDVVHMADYHMLVHHDDIFYNVPNPDEDEVLRADLGDADPGKDKLPANKPAKTFLDYLYIYEGSVVFKITEQTDRYNTFDWEHPMNPIDQLLYNFRKDQVDLNCLKPWSTYVTQEHNPGQPAVTEIGMNVVSGTDCRGVEEIEEIKTNLGALVVDADKSFLPVKWEYDPQDDESEADIIEKLYRAGYSLHTWEQGAETTEAGYQTFDISDADFDSAYKIYVNYQRVVDGSSRGYHFDLFFNIQNLFKPPFEYISTVTKQPAPAILPDSWLYLAGDEASLKAGTMGKLTLYIQLKYLVNDIAAVVKTVPLVTYDVYNISDDKPKFFIRKRTEAILPAGQKPHVTIKFEDVEIDPPTVTGEDGVITFKEPVDVTQTVSVIYNNNTNSDKNQLKTLNFAITKSKVSNSAASEPYIDIEKTEKFFDVPPVGEDGEFTYRSYPFRFNHDYQQLDKKNDCSYPVAYSFQDVGYTNEEMYLKWILPPGIDIFETYKKFGCIVKVGAIQPVAKMKSGDTATVRVIPGRIYMKAIEGDKKFLGREHGLNLTKYGYILTSVGNRLRLK